MLILPDGGWIISRFQHDTLSEDGVAEAG